MFRKKEQQSTQIYLISERWTDSSMPFTIWDARICMSDLWQNGQNSKIDIISVYTLLLLFFFCPFFFCVTSCGRGIEKSYKQLLTVVLKCTGAKEHCPPEVQSSVWTTEVRIVAFINSFQRPLLSCVAIHSLRSIILWQSYRIYNFVFRVFLCWQVTSLGTRLFRGSFWPRHFGHLEVCSPRRGSENGKAFQSCKEYDLDKWGNPHIKEWNKVEDKTKLAC